MDEITISYRARHTIIEMLADRGYSIPKEYQEINFFNLFCALNSNKQNSKNYNSNKTNYFTYIRWNPKN